MTGTNPFMTLERNAKGGKKTIYYDGDCPMCTVLIEKVKGSSREEAFDPKDITRDALPAELTAREAEKQIHVVGADGRVYKNAGAILQILEEYPKLRFLAIIGRLPVMRQMLSLGYRFVAANRRFIFGPARELFWMKVTVALGFGAGLLLSFRLWIGSHFFPITPVFEHLPRIPFPLGYSLLFILCISLLAIIVSSKPRKYIVAFLSLFAFLFLFDQTRLVPWTYQYFFILATLACFTWKKDAAGNEKDVILATLRLIIAGTYFWSGLTKVNLGFFGGVFPWLMEPFVGFLPDSIELFVYAFGIAVPWLEMGIGVGLLVKRYRKVAASLAIAMHLFILLAIGPLGHSWGSVVWPWNIAMIAFVLLLFWNARDFSVKEVLWVKNFAFQKVVLIFFIAAPVLSLGGLIDTVLSFPLYSGNRNTASVYVSDAVKDRLPDAVLKYTKEVDRGVHEVSIFDWSFGELNVEPYPETRAYKNIARYICAYARDPDDVALVVDERHTVINPYGRQSVYRCLDL